MNNEADPSSLPAQISDAVASVSKALVPNVIKAIDRLCAAAIDLPVAWLAQKKAKIEAQTESFKLVEGSVAQAAALCAGADSDITQRALSVLVRKEYRKLANREAVSVAMLEDLREHEDNAAAGSQELPVAELDEDWLNVFERYAEDASSDRLQGLWGRVLAGEIRKPGRYSTRTMRFLSEFSQADALTFETFAKSAFADAAPRDLVIPKGEADIRDLIYLEANGLIRGATGQGLQRTLTLDDRGYALIREGSLGILLKGEPKSKIKHKVIALTPLGQELLGLVTSRNAREAAKLVAHFWRSPDIHEAYLAVHDDVGAKNSVMEVLWLREQPVAQSMDGTTN